MKDTPIISVIIPVFNIESFIEDCIKSILNQSFTNYEIIFVNDGSTDNSVSIINKYMQQNSNLKLIHQENQGTGEARNNGLKNALGEYLLFIDADDTIENLMIEKLYQKAIEENADIVFCNINRIDSQQGQKIDSKSYKVVDKKALFKYILTFQYDSSVWAKLYKKSLFMTNKILFPSKLKHNEDNATFFKIIYYAKEISFLNQYLYNWRIVENSKSQTISKERLNSINSVLTIRYDFLTKYNIYHMYEDEFLLGMSRLLEVRIQNVLISNQPELKEYIIKLIDSLEFFTSFNLMKIKVNSITRYFLLLEKILKLDKNSILLNYFPKQDIDSLHHYLDHPQGLYRSILNQLEKQNIQDIYIYGVGQYFKELLPYLQNFYNILGVIDKNYKILNNLSNEYKVGSIEEIIKDDKNSTIVITSKSSVEDIITTIRDYSSTINIIHCYNI